MHCSRDPVTELTDNKSVTVTEHRAQVLVMRAQLDAVLGVVKEEEVRKTLIILFFFLREKGSPRSQSAAIMSQNSSESAHEGHPQCQMQPLRGRPYLSRVHSQEPRGGWHGLVCP